jgi:ribosomal protein L11
VTFSAARLHIPVDNAEKWTYQFDTLPSSSLANQQAAMTRRQEEKNVKQPSRFTDAEMEELAREARRTQRRKDRGK